MKSDRVFWLPRGWQPVHIGFCISEKAWKREVKRLGLPDLEWPHTDGRATKFEQSEQNNHCVIVTLKDPSKHSPIEIFGLLTHEAVHVWQFCCEVMGEVDAGIEIEAYSIQAITQELVCAYEQLSGRRAQFIDPKSSQAA